MTAVRTAKKTDVLAEFNALREAAGSRLSPDHDSAMVDLERFVADNFDALTEAATSATIAAWQRANESLRRVQADYEALRDTSRLWQAIRQHDGGRVANAAPGVAGPRSMGLGAAPVDINAITAYTNQRKVRAQQAEHARDVLDGLRRLGTFPLTLPPGFEPESVDALRSGEAA